MPNQQRQHPGHAPDGQGELQFEKRTGGHGQPIRFGNAPRMILHVISLPVMSDAPLDPLDNPNPSLSYYRRDDPAPVLPLREEPDLLTWLQTTGRLLQEEKYQGQDLSTVEEEELSVLMGERENYSKDDEQEDNWED